MAFLDVGDHEPFIIAGLTKIDTLNGAGVDDLGLPIRVQFLGFMNVAQGNIIEARVAHQ